MEDAGLLVLNDDQRRLISEQNHRDTKDSNQTFQPYNDSM